MLGPLMAHPLPLVGDVDEVGSGQHPGEALDVARGAAFGEGGGPVDAEDLMQSKTNRSTGM
ncbi:hypothetical protein ACFWWM_07440 [Streptomyces sp. NPDC058682]|uniref:hypothetical protein n=1 Tax=Streptomyces sp. NPDC058682 TaxID=3346596 RepID=UPI003663EDCC